MPGISFISGTISHFKAGPAFRSPLVSGVLPGATAYTACLLYTSVFLEEDGQTFLHLVTSQDDPSAVITGLPSFKKFQSELLASEPLQKPDQVGMSLVATSGDSYG